MLLAVVSWLREELAELEDDWQLRHGRLTKIAARCHKVPVLGNRAAAGRT